MKSQGAKATLGKYLAPLRGAIYLTSHSGGFRFAPTTGYFLATLRVDSLRTKSPFLHQRFHLRIAAAEVSIAVRRIDGVSN